MKAVEKGGDKNSSLSLTISWDIITIPVFNGISAEVEESINETSYIDEPVEYVEHEIYDETTLDIEIKSQNDNKWAIYDAAQTQEIRLFDILLKDLVETISEPIQDRGKGRPQIPIDEMIFCAVKKVYSKMSSRRAQGFPILHELIELSALPLAGIETEFAIDSTGFRTSIFGEYCRVKHKTTQKHKWLRGHFFIGVNTNIVTAMTITDDYGGDNPQFEGLVRRTAEGFDIKEVSADKAYSSRASFEIVGDVGGQAFIPFKKNATARAGGSPLWKKAYHMFQLNREEFDKHYHKRSNAESTIFAIKQKLGEKLASKNRVSQENELLCKVLAYNITVLIHEMFENGINPNFVLHKKYDE
jgi:transposase